MNARERQLRALAEEEATKWCPRCHRVGATLGAHDCDEPLTVEDARAQIEAQGGVLGSLDLRADHDGVQRTFDTALNNLTSATADLGAAIKVSHEAMETLKRAFTSAMFTPATGQMHVEERDVSAYKGIPVIEDPALAPGQFAVLSEREWEPVYTDDDTPADFVRRARCAPEFRLSALDGRPLGVLRGLA